MNVKNLFINKPAFILSEINYFKYIIYLSKFLNIIKFGKSLGYTFIISSIDNKTPIIEISGTDPDIRIQSPYRISRFLKGFKHAGARQWNRYQLSNLIKDELPEIFIDIGANIGEVSFFANQMGIHKIIAVEPDPVINDILKFNLRGTLVEVDNHAIGNINGKVSMYSSPTTADSSLLKSDIGSVLIKVESITLKNFVSKFNDDTSILIKMDAEGFEPEILKSAESTLRKIKYFSIDISPERMGKTTVVEVKEELIKNNFDIIYESSEIICAKRIGNYKVSDF